MTVLMTVLMRTIIVRNKETGLAAKSANDALDNVRTFYFIFLCGNYVLACSWLWLSRKTGIALYSLTRK